MTPILDVYALEIQMYTVQKNSKKLKVRQRRAVPLGLCVDSLSS
jgi:hypothetical protein